MNKSKKQTLINLGEFDIKDEDLQLCIYLVKRYQDEIQREEKDRRKQIEEFKACSRLLKFLQHLKTNLLKKE